MKIISCKETKYIRKKKNEVIGEEKGNNDHWSYRCKLVKFVYLGIF